ncbi:MAG: multidrug transporter [Nevskiales bacterium]
MAMKKHGFAIAKFCLLFGIGVSLATVPARAADTRDGGPAPSAEAMAVDMMLVRPASLVATVLGTGFFIISLPFSILGGNVDDAGKNLVLAPAKTTFIRPLGEFD